MRELESASVTKEQYQNMPREEKIRMASIHIGCTYEEIISLPEDRQDCTLETYEFMMGFN